MSGSGNPGDALVESGRDALSRGAWDEARGLFESAINEHETPLALEGLSWAAWWLNDADAVFAARESAFRRYRESGDTRSAARMAIWLASDYLEFRGEMAVANGWRERSRRLLGTLDEGAEHGWLALLDGTLALEVDSDPAAGREFGARAAELGVRLGLTDLEMLGLAVEGLALVTQGDVPEGMRRLDEAVTAAVAGEFDDVVSINFAACYLIYACERVRDYNREAEWCRQVEELAARLQIRQLLGECRMHYGGVLTWQGAWREAEVEFTRAAEDFAASRPLAAAENVVRLAELRRRQGRFSEADHLLEQVADHPLAALVRARLALDRDDAEQAAGLAQRRLRNLPEEDRTGRAAWLEVAAQAWAALGDPAEAQTAAVELQTIATTVGTEAIAAAATFTRGVVAAAADDHEAARRLFEDSTELLARCRAPFDLARSRIELARSLQATGRTNAAIEEVQGAARLLADLGARFEAGRAKTLLGELSASATDNVGSASVPLTRRQRDVLRLVATGLPDREIAHRLGLSEHTVHRHITNILTRLAVPSRAAAVARAKDLALL